MKRIVSSFIIALSALGLQAQQPARTDSLGFDNLPDPIEDVNKVVDNTPDSIAKALSARPASGSTRQGQNPVLFLVGNSTMRNGTLGNGNNGQWGWGYYFPKYFNAKKISVENQALGGMSTRTFYTDLWPAVRQALRPGDWVIVSIGHNDNGEFFDKRRARAVIPGVDPDTCYIGMNERTGRQDTVYSYGHYLRMYINDVRARGAFPILMSLTPRHAFNAADARGLQGGNRPGNVVRKPQTEWAAYVAAMEGVPFVDLNELSASRLDGFSPWKVAYHFMGDKIHTSKFGAELNARCAAEGLWHSANPQLAALQQMMQGVEPQTYQVDRTGGRPVVFFTGDSTVKNADSDDDGMWGWASQAYTVFDTTRVTLVNAAMAGRSTRTFVREGRWESVYNSLQPGEFVTIQFGHNDIRPIADRKARGTIPGSKDTLHVYKMDADGSYEVVYSFGWYLRKMIDDVREKGATPILVSLTPRNEWPGGRIERRDDTYGRWYREVVEQTGVDFIDMHNLSADFLDRKFAVSSLPADPEKAKAKVAAIKQKAGRYFKKDHTHASKLGAQMNAQSFARGLKAAGSPLAKYLKK